MNTGLPTPALNETFWQQRGSTFQVFGNIKKIHQDPQPPDKQPFAVKGFRDLSYYCVFCERTLVNINNVSLTEGK